MALPEEQTDSGTVPGRSHFAIKRGDVEAELANVFRLELAGLELNHEVAVQSQVIEQKIYIERALADIKGT